MRALSPLTNLAPGQRFAHPGAGDQQPTQQVTVARVERDPFGFLVVVFRGPDGRELTVYESQVAAAVEDGAMTLLSPELACSA